MKEELTQEGKSGFERRKMEHNYLYSGPVLNKVLIVDDVVTTGSSLKGAYLAIRDQARHIKMFSLAYKKIDLTCN